MTDLDRWVNLEGPPPEPIRSVLDRLAWKVRRDGASLATPAVHLSPGTMGAVVTGAARRR